jgi:hypothetical protein
VDVRTRTFTAEAERRFRFLATEYGFNGPEVIGASDEYPLMLTLRYSRGALAVEISLVLSYMGEECVTTRITPADRAQSPRDEITRDAAHTGYQMRRAIDHQAEAVLAIISQSARDHDRTELPLLYATEEPVVDSECRADRRFQCLSIG